MLLILISVLLVLTVITLGAQAAKYRILYKELLKDHKSQGELLTEYSETIKQLRKGTVDPFEKFQKDIQKYIEETGGSYAELSRKLNTDRSYISAVVNGRTRPSLEKAMGIVYELGFTEEEIQYYEQHFFPYLRS